MSLRDRIVALVVAGSLAAAGVVVLASALRLPVWGVVLAALTTYAVIGWRLFSGPGGAAGRTSPREVAMSDESTGAAPLVGIIMGSQSDMAVMQECASELEALGVPFEVVVASAHRQPAKVHDWAAGAEGRGIRVIVAAAGKAAHLGGVVAAYTTLPVITVPMKTSDLGGIDSLLSMVQMPTGVPVACVAINGAKNAAILTQPRLEYAIARDGLFFPVFGTLHPRYLTPAWSILIQSGLAILLFLLGNLENMLGYFTVSYALQNALLYGAIFFLRRRTDYAPSYRTPLWRVTGGLAVAIQLFIAGGTFLAYPSSGILSSAGLILTGLPIYLYYRRTFHHASP